MKKQYSSILPRGYETIKAIDENRRNNKFVLPRPRGPIRVAIDRPTEAQKKKRKEKITLAPVARYNKEI